MKTTILCILLAVPITLSACGRESIGALGMGGADDWDGSTHPDGTGGDLVGSGGQGGGWSGGRDGGFVENSAGGSSDANSGGTNANSGGTNANSGGTNANSGGTTNLGHAGGTTSVASDGGMVCCPPDPTTAGCMKLGGKAVGGVCPTTCDFFCSENWRIEKDSDGCVGWRYERRAPRAGENSFCMPVPDGSSGGDGPDSAPASCNSWVGAVAVGGHWYAGNCQACTCTAEGAVCTERCELQSDGGLHDVCESTYHSRLVPGSPAKCPVCGPDSSQFPVQCDEQGLACHYEGSNVGALCTCSVSPLPTLTDAASASLVFVCLG